MELYGISIKQDMDTSFMSITDLQKAYTKAMDIYGFDKQRLFDITNSYSFKKTIYNEIAFRGSENVSEESFFNSVNDLGLIKVLKRMGYYKTTGRGESKEILCVDWLWKYIYLYFFNLKTQVSTPQFILDINVNQYDKLATNNSIKRKDSLELSFINRFILSSDLICDGVEKQFNFKGFIFDLKIELLGTTYLIEYHEKHHRRDKDLKNDKDKFDICEKHAYPLIVVPYNKENEQISFIKEALKNKYDAEYINSIEKVRHYSLLEKRPDYPKISRTLNTKVFGFHQTGMRNLASAKELRKISDIEKFITNAIKQKWLKTEEDVLKAMIEFETNS
jgi:uncharacterized protein YcgL (UPF0745 family)